jgi:hypothetical protein
MNNFRGTWQHIAARCAYNACFMFAPAFSNRWRRGWRRRWRTLWFGVLFYASTCCVGVSGQNCRACATTLRANLWCYVMARNGSVKNRRQSKYLSESHQHVGNRRET